MAFLAALLLSQSSAWALDASQQQHMRRQLAALEQSANGRLGVSLIDTADGTRFDYRADERFPLCSTSKIMAVAALLKRSEIEPGLLDQSVEIKRSDLVNYNPITARHVGARMTLRALSAAAMQYSDNAAMNLLIERLGGPQSVTRFSRDIGDRVFRLDRAEPELNAATPGDERDTTSPAAMAATLRALALGPVLQDAGREQLVAWLKGNTTGAASIRAGVPASWLVGDKTGNGGYGSTNDIAVIWPAKRPPLVLAIYFTQKDPAAAPRRDVLARAAGIVTQSEAR
jgi:beta-lactamase class A